MATIQLRTDDLNGETLPEDTPTTRIYVEDGREHVSIEIDLSDDSFKTLLKALNKYASKGRPILPEKKAKPSGTNTEAAMARAWALTQPDIQVSERGAVPNRVLEAYREFLTSNGTEQPDGPSTEEERKGATDS